MTMPPEPAIADLLCDLLGYLTPDQRETLAKVKPGLVPDDYVLQHECPVHVPFTGKVGEPETIFMLSQYTRAQGEELKG